MLRLQNQQLVSSLRAAAAASSLLRRLLLCTDASPTQFTPSQGPKASRSLSILTTPDPADAVRAFLADELGIYKSDVASAITRRASRLGVKAENTLAPCVSRLRDIGLSNPEIARLVPLVPSVLISPEHISRLAYYMSLLGSFDKVHSTIRTNRSLLAVDIGNVLEPNIAFLLKCGLTVRDFAYLLYRIPRLLAGSKERLEDVVLLAEQLGVPRGTPMFRHALIAAYSTGRETIKAKMELLKSLGLSSRQVAMAVAKMPAILGTSDDRLRRAMDFLSKEAGMGMEIIAQSPAMLKYSIEGRLAPRLKVLKLIQEKGLPGSNSSFYTMSCLSEKQFRQKFLLPNEKSIPDLTAVYVAALSAKELPGAATS